MAAGTGISSGDTDIITRDINSENFEVESNRLPILLKDVKLLMADAVIADVHQDTMEVMYLLDRIFDLLEEAEQFGEMTPDDSEEFSRFEAALIDLYTHQLTTVEEDMVAVSADQISSQITEFVEPVEVENGSMKFTVIDDREGHVPLLHNQRVEKAIKFFQTNGRDQFEIWLKRFTIYQDLVSEILEKYAMPPEILYLALIESGMNPKAYSRANAVGMWQFIYSTGKRYGLKRTWYVDERRDPRKATEAAVRYLTDLYGIFEDWYLAMSAYNAGQGRIQRAINLHETSNYWQLYSLPRETRNYIPTYLAAALICRDPAKYGFTIPTADPLKYDEVELAHSAELAVLARCAGISVRELRYLNPELRQSATPSEGKYWLKIPTGRSAEFEKVFSAIPESQRFAPEYLVHRVRYGQTLWDISRKYKVSIHELASVNRIRNRHKIRVGQKLTIPIRGLASTPAYVAQGPRGHDRVVYVVRSGDTLGQIAEDYKTRASRIRKWNNLRYGQYIYPGQKLTLWIPKG